MEYEWVIGRFDGKQAEWVDDGASKSIGYFIQRTEGRGKARTVYAAFIRPMDGPRPSHLDLASLSQVQRLEEMRSKRSGVKL